MLNQEKINYQKLTDKITESIGSSRPKLLLHACCGPCSSYVIEYLSAFFEITVLFYNPNIYPQQEYERRRDELLAFYPRFEKAKNIKVIVLDYDTEIFYESIGVKQEPELAREKEKGERCRRCYEFRLKKTYKYARENGFDWFCTTLSISPFKDSYKLNEIGEALCKNNPDGPSWLYSDFKKKGGFKRSLELSSEFGLYRQDYCGCVYSLRQSRATTSS